MTKGGLLAFPRLVPLLLYAAVFWVLILIPFDFHSPRAEIDRVLGSRVEGLMAIASAISLRLSKSMGHFVLFLPLPPLLAWTFRWSWRELYAPRTVIAVLGIAFASELAQLTVSRGASLIDANMNIFGYAVGVAFVAIWHEIPSSTRKFLEGWAPAGAALVFAASLAAMVLLVRPASGFYFGPKDLEVWDASYPFLLGNELTRSRPWAGVIERCAVYPGAIRPGKDASHPPAAVHYEFRPEDMIMGEGGEVGGVRARAGPDLIAVTGHPLALPGGGVEIPARSLLSTPQGWREAVQALRSAPGFTLEVRFQAKDATAKGPARIVSSSINNRYRNFTLGQDGRALELRVRTPLTGPNGTPETLRVDDCIEPDRSMDVAAIYEGGRMELYVDGKLRGAKRIHVLGWICPEVFSRPLDRTIAAGLAFVGWTVLLGGLWMALRGRLPRRRGLAIATLVASILMAVLVVSTAAAAPAPPGAWPAWRGPRGDGVSAEPAPVLWSRTEGIDWTFEDPGLGYSSPIAHEESVFLTTADGDQRLLFRLGLRDGREVWRREVLRAPVEGMHKKNSAASATPATDGDRIYTAFFADPRVVVTAHDMSGKEVWSVSPGEFHSMHGFCATPVLHGELVILNCDQDADAYIVALERKTGKEAWRADRENKLRSYCPPLLFEAGGRTQMALSGSKTISSYDPLTGRRLWVCDGPTEQCVASLVHGSGLIFVTGGYPDREILAIDPTGRGDVTETHVRWRSRKGVSYVPSPVHHRGHFFVVSDTGVLSAIEARSGEYRGQKRLDGNFSASLLIAGSHLYASSEEGVVHVFRAEPELGGERRIDMGETIFATPAALPGRLLLRTSERLYAIRGVPE